MEQLFSLLVLLTAAELFQCTLGNCGDGSDERGCEAGNIQCGPRGRLCGPEGPCLPLERFCDGHKDCRDGSDEAGKACGDSHTRPLVKCRKDEFRCAPDADCYPLAFICDRHNDCPDKRDEVGCVFEVPSSPETPETIQPGSTAASEIMTAEHWVVLAIVALLVIMTAVVWVAVWVSRKAKPLLMSFSLDKASEQLMRKEQP